MQLTPVAVVALMLALPWQVCADEGSELNQVIGNLRSHERLYSELEVKLTYRFQLLKPLASHHALKLSKVNRTVLQSGMYYLDCSDDYEAVSGQGSKFTVTAAYDGSKTRRYQQQAVDISKGPSGKFGHIIDGLAQDLHVVSPHSMILETLRVNFPLSTLLSGTAALVADKRVQQSFVEGNQVDVEYGGETDVGGLRCVALSFTRIPKQGNPNGLAAKHTIWLATERNFLPVRHIVSSPTRYKTDEPYEVGKCDEFFELDNGVWFPKSMTVDQYVKNDGGGKKRCQVLLWIIGQFGREM